MKLELSEKFQRQFLAAMLKSPEIAFTYRHIVRPEYFSSEALVAIAECLFDYIDKYVELPSPPVLGDKLVKDTRKYLDTLTIKAILKVLKSLYSLPIKDTKYISDQISKFAEEMEWRSLLIDAPDLLEAEDFDGLFTRCMTAREKGNFVPPYDYIESTPSRMEESSQMKIKDIFKTGIRALDEKIQIFPPAYALIIGKSSSGKSWFLVHLAKAGFLQGKRMLLFTGEMSPNELAIRLDASLLGINTSFFYCDELKEKLSARLESKHKKLGEKHGKLNIISFPAKQFSIQDIDATIKKFAMKGPVDLVMIDYLEMLSYMDSEKRKFSGWEELMWSSTYCKGLSKKYKTIIVANSMAGGEEDIKLVTRDQKALGKYTIYAPDYAFTINRNNDDKRIGQTRIFVDKARNAEDSWIIGILTDLRRSLFCVKSLGAIRRSEIEDDKSS